MTAARPHPPGSQRIAEARASGHLPNAPLVGFVSALLSVLAAACWLGPQLARSWTALLRTPLELAASGQTARAHAALEASVRALGVTLVLALVACFVAVLLGRLLGQGLGFARLSSSLQKRFPVLGPSRSASVLWCLGLCLSTCFALSEWSQLEPATLAEVGSRLLTSLTVSSLACLAIDVAFARARFFASLWLTRREFVAEQRDAFGAPELRAARARARAADRDAA